MRPIKLGDQLLTDVEINMMSIPELNSLTLKLQEAIHSTVIEKNKLTMLPKNQKNGLTISRVRKLSERLMNLQNTANFVSMRKKSIRDDMSAERDCYKNFYLMAKNYLPAKLLKKLVEETNKISSYQIQ